LAYPTTQNQQAVVLQFNDIPNTDWLRQMAEEEKQPRGKNMLATYASIQVVTSIILLKFLTLNHQALG
jgi:hypothetical protein